MLSHPRTVKRFTAKNLQPLSLGMLLLTSLTVSATPFSPLSNNDSSELRFDPLSWWAGMQNPQLQLMVHGDKIASKNLSINGDDIKLLGVETTDNPNYLFINLDLNQAKPQEFTLSFTDNKGQQQHIAYSLNARNTASAQRQGFSNKDAIYLITPDRFVNGDQDNDNHPEMLELVNRTDKDGRHGGDIKGIINSLDHLDRLGVTQLWINPLIENNQAKYSYHGYSVTDHYRIDPRFGSNADYRQLSQDAAKRGIGIIADVVVNHIGSNHWWMEDLPSHDWINKPLIVDTPTSDNQFTSHRRTTVQDPYAVSRDTVEFTDGWFVDTMPDLNQKNPLLATYLIQNSIWWIEYANLSGIREDTYSYADKHFLNQWAKAILTEYPRFNIVGEEWSANPITVSYWQKGKLNRDGYRAYLPSLMDFPLYETLLAALNETEGWDTGLIKLYEFLANDLVYADPTQLVLFEGNHDTNRLYSLLGNDLALTQMAVSYVLLSNRIPQLFYGTEILMESPNKGRNDGEVRADYPGGWENDAISVFDNKGLTKAQRSMFNFTKTLLNYRKHSMAISQGGLRHFVPHEGIYVQIRCEDSACNQGAKLLSIYNKNNKPITVDLANYLELVDGKFVDRQIKGRNIISGQLYQLSEPLTLNTKGVTIIDIQGAL